MSDIPSHPLSDRRTRPRSGLGLALGIALGALVPAAFGSGWFLATENARRDARNDLRVARQEILEEHGEFSSELAALSAIERAYMSRTGDSPLRLLWD